MHRIYPLECASRTRLPAHRGSSSGPTSRQKSYARWQAPLQTCRESDAPATSCRAPLPRTQDRHQFRQGYNLSPRRASCYSSLARVSSKSGRAHATGPLRTPPGDRPRAALPPLRAGNRRGLPSGRRVWRAGAAGVRLLDRYEPRWAEGLHLLEAIVRSPWALATLLEAAGPGAEEQVGRIRARRVPA